ncbi:MAG: hypothetical protein HY912_21675 [Desulfomonile tiedjei]|uniref:Spermidine synthase n=1 Tax=Desulfomonile tiedjei TaxID=2358 RepID=A0A9D6V595_9BACT|nr:hypothetical protein [Desulfomonile tiedjei]
MPRFGGDRLLLPAVFFISFAAVGWQLALMRCLLISRYHHFSFLVISCALLGFGAGGTVLTLAGPWLQKRQDSAFRWGTLLFAVSLPACFRVGELLPLSVYFPPVALGPTLAWWFLFWLIHCVPFLLAGLLIGLALMSSKETVSTIYASNLAGSAAGALGSIALLAFVPANGLVNVLSAVVILSGFFPVLTAIKKNGLYTISLILAGLLTVTSFLFDVDKIFPLNTDQYKPLAYVERLEAQGNAERIASRYGPRGRIDLYSSSSFHSLLSLSSREAPPPMDMLLVDGFQAGSVLRVKNPAQARFLGSTLSALPYKLLQRPDRVLILGETDGLHIWAARLTAAHRIVVVQPDSNIIDVLREHESSVLQDKRIAIMEEEPRAFLDGPGENFQVIQLAGLQGFSAGSGGIGGLRENYIATVEGYGRCLAHLSDNGIACLVRGIQDPERDNLKIAATWLEALQKAGASNPENHLLSARDELSLVTLVGKSEFPPEAVRIFRKTAKENSWDVEWFPGVRPEDTNRVHVLPGPEGTSISWYHYGLRKLLSPEREAFYEKWICNIRPATDNSPFFYDFFKWRSISVLAAAFGPLWPARAEMGFLLLLVALVWTITFAAVLLPAPVILLRRSQERPTGAFISVLALYFAGLGTGFMFLEMSFIQIFTRFFGDSVIAAAIVVGSFLFFAGLGSISCPFLTRRLPGGVLTVAAAIAFLVLIESTLFAVIFKASASVSGFPKYILGIGLMAPLAFLMGIPFPWGLTAVHDSAQRAVPLAWAINGFASVISASAAVLVAMVFGFYVLLGLAAVMYLGAGLLSRHLGTRNHGRSV